MQWHWDVEIESIVVAHAHNEEHCHENAVVDEANAWLDSATFGGEEETVHGDEEKLQECDEIAGTGISSKNMCKVQLVDAIVSLTEFKVQLYSLDQQLQENHICTAADKDTGDAESSFCAHS